MLVWLPCVLILTWDGCFQRLPKWNLFGGVVTISFSSKTPVFEVWKKKNYWIFYFKFMHCFMFHWKCVLFCIFSCRALCATNIRFSVSRRHFAHISQWGGGAQETQKCEARLTRLKEVHTNGNISSSPLYNVCFSGFSCFCWFRPSFVGLHTQFMVFHLYYLDWHYC